MCCKKSNIRSLKELQFQESALQGHICNMKPKHKMYALQLTNYNQEDEKADRQSNN